MINFKKAFPLLRWETNTKELVESVVSSLVMDVAISKTGFRNRQLHISAVKIAYFISGGFIDGDVAKRKLITAAEQNGLIADDGLASVEKTIDEAFNIILKSGETSNG